MRLSSVTTKISIRLLVLCFKLFPRGRVLQHKNALVCLTMVSRAINKPSIIFFLKGVSFVENNTICIYV